jgi:hypothetical protein
VSVENEAPKDDQMEEDEMGWATWGRWEMLTKY